MFEWDRNNLRKILAHGIRREEAEAALTNELIPIYRQEVGGEDRLCVLRRDGRREAAGGHRYRTRRSAASGDRLRFGCGAAARLYWEATRRRVNGEENDGDTEV